MMKIFARIKMAFFAVSVTALMIGVPEVPCFAIDLPLDKIRLPEGFIIEVYANVLGARSLAVGDDGTVFVGTRGLDKVYTVVDQNHDYIADRLVIIDEGLNVPNGVAFHNG